jgi:hypothetical protein
MSTCTSRRRVSARAAILAALAVVVLLVFATSAVAAPTEPTLTVDELRAKLESGPLDGYLKTVVHGYTIEKIPVTVSDIVELSWGNLILAEASGPVIDQLGSIASGMSGSPVFVDDGGVDKLIGALSYGSDFTVGGTFMATPIGYMSALEADYVKPPAAGTYKLAEPVQTDGGRIDSVVIARGVNAATQIDARAGQLVMAPLGLIEIGGLPPQTRAYKELAAKLEKQTGLPVVAASGGSLAPPEAPPLEGGSSIFQLFSQGSVWYGSAGTATYVDGDVVVAYGHPAWWTGPCGAAMAGGYVSGIWPSQWAPFKLMAPRDIKGTIVQDRNWGLAGILGQDPDMIPVTSTVTFPEQGDRVVSTTSTAAEWAFRTDGYQDLAGYLVMQALWDACDVSFMPGSAETTTTVHVSDETGPYVVTIDNTWDSFDITFEPVFDVMDALWALSADPDGVLDVRLDSVDFQATVSSTPRSARLVEILLPDGLKTGDNVVELTYYAYGSRDLQTLTTTLTIPAGTPPSGTIEVTPANWSSWEEGVEGDAVADPAAPATLAEIVDALNNRPKNSDLIVTFYPREEGGGPEPSGEQSSPAARTGEPSGGDASNLEPVEVTVSTAWVFQDMLSISTIPVTLDAMPARVDLGEPVMLSGTVQGVAADVPVSIFRVDAATGDETLVDTVTAAYAEGMATFETMARPTLHNTTFVARVGGLEGWLPGSAEDTVRVRAEVRLARSVEGRRVLLAPMVRPSDTGGKVAVQRYVGGSWRTVATLTLNSSGSAVKVWPAPGPGTYRFRAKFLGSALNAAGTSAVARVVVR